MKLADSEPPAAAPDAEAPAAAVPDEEAAPNNAGPFNASRAIPATATVAPTAAPAITAARHAVPHGDELLGSSDTVLELVAVLVRVRVGGGVTVLDIESDVAVVDIDRLVQEFVSDRPDAEREELLLV